MRRMTWGERLVAIAILIGVLTAGYLAYASSVDAGKLGPTLAFNPLGGDAKTLVKQASMGFSEQPGFIRVSGVWYKIHWRFADKRIEFHRTLAPSGTKMCVTWEAPDDED